MTSTQSIPPLAEQVRAALDSWTEIHEHAEAAAAAYGETKRLVGSNETERKERKSNTPPDDYAMYLVDLVQHEQEHKAAAAAVERAEKSLNTLRELLSHETAQIEAATAVQWAHIADQEARTAGSRTTMLEIRARYPQRTVIPSTPVDPEAGF